ncbi:heavy metal transport detoxification protein [Leptolyngbya sp. Heron Island J]|uniref:heavy-metal-associated domain-containing protein n=1 Tax=Leptolyngbya sp. Heron Island J TaxID=1385935 RepID=UPI0003B9C516|nr:heavy-metal-associated domain-containing protein [Leptolyngbya sp. Heron Island J]ESA38804.1 heavy metal transport detoxification protein [Leptolyngbya sp. Heron Island J]
MTLQLTVPNMACDVCAKNITNAVKALDSKATVTADPKTKQVDIETETAETAIREALEQAGYPASA